MNRNRVIYRSILSVVIVGSVIGELVTLFNGDHKTNNAWWGVWVTFIILWLLSFLSEHIARLTALDRETKQTRQQTTALIGRVADLMDSAHRLDPTYREKERARKEREEWARKNGMPV